MTSHIIQKVLFGLTLTFSLVAYSETINSRSVGEVDCAGINANEAMIQSGLALVYRKYDKGYEYLYALEEDDRNVRRGLWADSNPIAHWDWRNAKRNKGS